jgi:HrpA-like RNA helicase
MQMTDIGRKMSRLGVEPSIARLLLAGAESGRETVCLDLAGMLSIRDPVVQLKNDPARTFRQRAAWSRNIGDHVMLVTIYREYVRAVLKGGDRNWCRENNLMAQSMRQAHLARADYARRLAAFEKEDRTWRFVVMHFLVLFLCVCVVFFCFAVNNNTLT